MAEAQQEAATAQAKAKEAYRPRPEVASRLAARASGLDVVHNDVIEIVGPSGRIRQVLDGGSASAPRCCRRSTPPPTGPDAVDRC